MSTLMRAEVLGYCMGVRRAMNAADKALKDNPDSAVYTLGPLIHNKVALEKLASRGLRMLNENDFEVLGENQGSASKQDTAYINEKGTSVNRKTPVVIIRAHGIGPDVRKKLKKTGVFVIDATCPRVLANQRLIETYAKRKYLIIIAGDGNHGEVSALMGVACAAGTDCRVIQNTTEAAALARDPIFLNSPAVLICQTTISFEEYKAVKDILCAADTDLKIFDTICPATEDRQNALRTLCKKVEGIVVVGGKESANTKRLFQLASALCKHVVHIECAEELPEFFFHLKTVGITAGASTPDEVIRDVEKRFESFFRETRGMS